jgi:Homeodomain-like domain
VDRVRVAALLATGMSVRDIADEIGISKSAVHRQKQMIEQEAAEAAAGSGRCRNGGLMALSRVPPALGGGTRDSAEIGAKSGGAHRVGERAYLSAVKM